MRLPRRRLSSLVGMRMTSPELLGFGAPSVERVVVAWLKPLGRTGTRRKAGDPVPFRLVHRVAGSDDPVVGIDVASVSVHSFGAGDVEALAEAERSHRRMNVLSINPMTTISNSDILGVGVVVNVDYCIPRMAPTQVDYEDPAVVRYVARYEIGISYTPVG